MKTKGTHPFQWTRLLSALAVVFSGSLAAGGGKDDWPPIAPEELAIKDNPASPGAHAMILYREEFSDDVESFRTEYYRIKIFDDEGKKYADIEIPFFKGISSVKDIKARTVHPDGSAVNFGGRILQKVIIKARGVKLLAATFTLPEVQLGSIIEYKYRAQYDPDALLNTEWVLQENLFTRRARFSIHPYTRGPALFWRTFGLPPSKQVQKEGGLYGLDLENVPAFQEEEDMPPEAELKSHVDFFYRNQEMETTEQFWKRVGKDLYNNSEQFIGKRGGIRQAAAQLLAPNDPLETKLRKLFAAAQKIRNLSFETEKEEKREKLKENNNVEDVLKHSYGTGLEINRLFIALARAADFGADEVLIVPRGEAFFHPDLQDTRQLRGNVVVVHLGSQDLYLDPATRFCPFGLLPWEETDAGGIRLTKNGGMLISTAKPETSSAVIERKANSQLDAQGTLVGKIQIVFAGQPALEHRLDAVDQDESGRRKQMAQVIRKWLPPSSDFESLTVTGWESAEEPLRVDGNIRVPNFGVIAGHRILLPVSLFQSGEARTFEHANRVHPVYLTYPYQVADDVTIRPPADYQVESVPSPHKTPPGVLQYEIEPTRQAEGLRIQRRLKVEGMYFPLKYYGALRAFFSTVKTGDEDQAVLKAVEKAAQN